MANRQADPDRRRARRRRVKELIGKLEAGVAHRALSGEGSLDQHIDYTVEARYPHQIWEIEVPMAAGRFRAPED